MKAFLAPFVRYFALLSLALSLLGHSTSPAQTLYVANGLGTTVNGYNATTGGAPALTMSDGGGSPMAVLLSGNNLYAANGDATVTEYNATTGGAPILSISTGVSNPQEVN